MKLYIVLTMMNIEYIVYCEICDKLCIERSYKSHMKSGTHTINFYKRQRLKNCFH